MEDQKFSLSGTFQKGKEYIDTQVELMKLKAISKVTRLLGSLIVDVATVLFVLFVIFFLSLAFAFFLGELFNSNALGFLATGGLFLLLILLIKILRPNLEKMFMNLSIRKVLSKWGDDDDEEEEENSKTTNTTDDNSIKDESFTENK